MRIVSAASAFPTNRHFPPKTCENWHNFVQTGEFWIETAVKLGQQAICRALNRAGLAREDLGALFFVSITGIASPSIDARLVSSMGLSPRIRRIPMLGLGCVAGAAGVSLAASYVRAYPEGAAVLISLEPCSLTGLRGDGAAAAIFAGSGRDLPGIEIVATRSVLYPDTQDLLGWATSKNALNIAFSTGAPDTVRKHLAHDVDAFLGDVGLTRADIGTWMIHTQGPKMLEATEESLDLAEGALDASWESLGKTRNLTPASLLLVLECLLLEQRPAAGTWSVLAVVGPAFCSELVLLRW